MDNICASSLDRSSNRVSRSSALTCCEYERSSLAQWPRRFLISKVSCFEKLEVSTEQRRIVACRKHADDAFTSIAGYLAS
eukprot:6200492-Pleurochrysis_carterae.AAC.1